ncbi:MAG: cytosine permease [Treponema sp.]|jgi:NCS1 family nucleobase:cation symporter-1|nr:cytosine permease [Treponema sp.]
MSNRKESDVNFLVSEEILPTTEGKRTISALDLFFIWAAIAINIGGFAMAFSLYPQFSPLAILGIVFLGYLICVILIVFIGDIGLTYGITYSVFIRSSFGYLGSHLPGLVRVVSCLFWCGFQTWLAATAMDAIMVIATGYSNLWLMIILFTIIQVANACFGIKAMAKFDGPAVVFLLIVLAVLLGTIINMNNTSVITIMQTAADPTAPKISIALAISGAAGGWIAIPVTFMDISRTMKRKRDFATQSFWQRNKGVVFSTLVGITIISPVMMLCGLISGVLTGTWNPIEFAQIAFASKPAVLIICFLSILFAQWSTNTAANMLPAANILVNINPKLVKFPYAMILVGILSVVIRPWIYLSKLYFMLAILSALVGPLLGILLTDYYILRKRKLNVPALFKKGSQYEYANNFNPAGIISLVVSCVIGMLCSMDFALYIGMAVSMILYYVLMKYWIIKKYPQAELDPDYNPVYDYDGRDIGFGTDPVSGSGE